MSALERAIVADSIGAIIAILGITAIVGLRGALVLIVNDELHERDS